MFSLLVGFWQLLFRRAEFHVLILGVDAAGKTTVLEQIKATFLGREPMPPAKIAPTVGLNIGRLQVRRCKLICWDLGGQAALRAIWEKYYSEAHGLIYVVDAADTERIDESRNVRAPPAASPAPPPASRRCRPAEQVLHALLGHPDLAGIPLLLLANKQDAPGALSPHEVEARFGLQQVLETSQPRQVFGTAALTGERIEESIHWLVEAER